MTDNTKPTAADIADMTDAELNRAIAEARGWTELGVYQHGPVRWHGGIPPGATRDRDFPHWSTDANAALGLLREMNQRDWDEYEILAPAYTHYWNADLEHWEVNAEYDGRTKLMACAPTPARAIAEAWYAWRLGQSGE